MVWQETEFGPVEFRKLHQLDKWWDSPKQDENIKISCIICYRLCKLRCEPGIVLTLKFVSSSQNNLLKIHKTNSQEQATLAISVPFTLIPGGFNFLADADFQWYISTYLTPLISIFSPRPWGNYIEKSVCSEILCSCLFPSESLAPSQNLTVYGGLCTDKPSLMHSTPRVGSSLLMSTHVMRPEGT